ncbi:MAG: hypothetical protein U0354_16330 [Candidatus Sericytochromatia bacterium]
MKESKSTFSQGKTCPLQLEEKFIPCDIKDLEPISSYLKSKKNTSQTISFPRGTIIDGNRLDLCKQKIGIEGAKLITESLFDNQDITSLMFGADGIFNEGAIAVSKLLEKNETIETVYLGCNLIDEVGASALANSLLDNKSVKSLWIKRNPIGDKGLDSISEMLKTNNSINTLDLVNTEFTLNGLKNLVEVLLENNNSINELYLGGNHINKDGAFEIAKLLEKNNIEHLFLNVNNIGDEGIKYISEKLKENISLKSLGLASNNISSIGAKELFEVLKDNKSLEKLDLGYSPSTKVLGEKANCIDDDCLEYIHDFFKSNNTLKSIDFVNNNFSDIGLEKIIESLENNFSIIKFTINLKNNKELSYKLRDIINRNKEKDGDLSFSRKNIEAIKSVYRTK